ncbi:MAG: hypothetical protein ABR915_13775 [Thermoguttaceae bacterium]|jgi:phenylacetate-CoA ligase
MNLLRYLPRFRAAYRSLPLLAAREQWRRGEIESFQLERLNRVWQHAVAHVPHYREMAARQRLPATFGSLAAFQAAVPILTKAEVRAEPKRFLSERRSPGIWRRTAGSTGIPLSVYWAHDAHWEVLRTQYRFYEAWNVDIFDRKVFLWGHATCRPPGLSGWLGRFRMPIEDRLRGRLRLSACCVGRDDLREYLRRIAGFRPVSLYGYSQSLCLLAREAEVAGFSCDSLRLAVLTSEPLLPSTVERVERVFGAPAVSEYGSTECGLIAQEWPDRILRVREDTVLVETLPSEGRNHEIIVSPLNNPSFPLLRYNLGDATDAPLERPERGFAVLKNVTGRPGDFLISRSGRYIHSTWFDITLRYFSPAIRCFRIRQRADGSVWAAIELDGSDPPFDVAALEQRIREVVEGYPARVEIVDSIPTTAVGKHRLVVSELSQPTEKTAGNGGGTLEGSSNGSGGKCACEQA